MAGKILGVVLTVAAFAHAQPRIVTFQAESHSLPDHWKYHLVFRALDLDERLARDAEAGGRPAEAEAWRAHYQHKAGLTYSEAETLKSVGTSCRTQEKAELAKAEPLIAELRRLLYHPDASMAPATRAAQITQVRSQLNQLDQEHIQILQGCVSVLQSSLGTASFKRLDSFVKKESAQHDRLLSPPRPSGPPVGGQAAPAGGNQ